MSFAGINYIAVLLATIASFVFGGVWYGALSKKWMEVAGRTASDVSRSRGPVPWPLLIAFLAELLMAIMLAGVIGHLGAGQVTLWNGIVSAFFIWLGFVVTTLAVNHAFQEQPPILTVIDSAHWLGVLLIQGAILGLMGV